MSEITIPSSVQKIEDNVFSGCTSLNEITIPSSVQTVYSGIFSGCSNLKKIYVPFKEGEKPAGWSDVWSEGTGSSNLEIIYKQ